TWDGYPAVRTSFDLDGSDPIGTRLSAISTALSGQAATVGMTSHGPFKALMTVVLRNASRTIVVLGLVPTPVSSRGLGFIDTMAGGSVLAQAGDTLAASQCESINNTIIGKADLLWVVDDSGSMASSQHAVYTVGTQLASRITNTLTDLRFAGVST